MRPLTATLTLLLLSGALAVSACQANRDALVQASCGVEGEVDDDGLVCRDGFWQDAIADVSDLDAADTTGTDAVVGNCSGCGATEHCCPQPDGTVLCVANDALNCGGCGIACGEGQTCAAGTCVCAVGRTDCDADPNTCEISLLTNAEHCGECGLACDATEICADAACTCGTTECAADKTCCGDDLCIDTTSHAQHCGGCGQACGTGEVCRDGACQCGDGPGCEVGSRCCTDVCVPQDEPCPCGGVDCTDTQLCCSDSCVGGNTRQNCGGCGVSCRGDQSCEGGTCTCTGSTIECDGACVDVTRDPDHCGSCGTSCGSGESCCGGECRDATNPCSWWDTDWDLRFPITLEPQDDLPMGAVVPLVLDHAAMIAAGQSQPDAGDLRVVRFVGGSWTPVAATRDPQFAPGGDDTVIWFQLDASLSVGSDDTSYFLYAQNASPTSGLQAYDDVLEFGADFDGSSLPAALDRQTQQASFELTGGRLELNTMVSTATYEAGLMWLDQPLPSDDQWHARVVARWDDTRNAGRLLLLGVLDALDGPELLTSTGAPNDSKLLVRTWGETAQTNVSIYPQAGDTLYWDSDAGWNDPNSSPSTNGYDIPAMTWMVVELFSDGTEVFTRVSDLATGTQVLETTPYAWNDLDSPNHPGILAWGERWVLVPGGQLAWDSVMLRRWHGTDPTVQLGAAQPQP